MENSNSHYQTWKYGWKASATNSNAFAQVSNCPAKITFLLKAILRTFPFPGSRKAQ